MPEVSELDLSQAFPFPLQHMQHKDNPEKSSWSGWEIGTASCFEKHHSGTAFIVHD